VAAHLEGLGLVVEMLSCFWISSVKALPPMVMSRVKVVMPRARMLMLATVAPTLIRTTVSVGDSS
jgi:hypothetical protein